MELKRKIEQKDTAGDVLNKISDSVKHEKFRTNTGWLLKYFLLVGFITSVYLLTIYIKDPFLWTVGIIFVILSTRRLSDDFDDFEHRIVISDSALEQTKSFLIELHETHKLKVIKTEKVELRYGGKK